MTLIHSLNRLSCYSLEAQELILIYLTVYYVPISSAYGIFEDNQGALYLATNQH